MEEGARRRRGVRWTSLSASLLVITSAGTVYSFGAYSEALKKDLGLSQTQVEVAALCANVGNYAGLGGFAVDAFGVRPAASFGTALIGIGYGSLWLLLRFRPLADHARAVWACCAIWGHGSGYLDSAAIVTGSKLFPRKRGSVVGLLKSLYGLSSSLVVLAVARIVGQRTLVGILALLAVILPSLNIAHLLVPPVENEVLEDHRRIAGLAARVLALAISVGLAAVATAHAQRRSVAALLVSVGVSLGLLAATTPRCFAKKRRDDDDDDSVSVFEASALLSAGSVDYSPTEALRSVRLWLMLAVVFPVSGCGLMTINNLAQIVAARGARESTRDVAVALVSVANCLGRLLTGIASDKLLVEKKNGRIEATPRPVLLCASAALASLSMLTLYASRTSVTFCLVGVVLAGASYGMLWTLIPTLVADFFGLARIGSNYMLCLPAVVLGSVLFSTLLASSVYSHSPTYHDDNCVGTPCFAKTFLVTALACALSTLSAAFLTFKTRHLYRIKQTNNAAAPLIPQEPALNEGEGTLLAT